MLQFTLFSTLSFVSCISTRGNLIGNFLLKFTDIDRHDDSYNHHFLAHNFNVYMFYLQQNSCGKIADLGNNRFRPPYPC